MPANPEGGEWTQVNVAQSADQQMLSGWEPEPEPEPEPQALVASKNWKTYSDRPLAVGSAASGAQTGRVLRPLLEMLQPLFLRHRDIFAVLDKNGDGVVERRELRLAFESTGIDIMGESTSRDLDRLFDALDKNGDGQVDMVEFADMIQVEIRASRGTPTDVARRDGNGERKVLSGPAGRPVPITDRPSAIDAPIEGRAVGDGDAFEVLFEGNFKQMLHAVGRRPTGPGYTDQGERVDVRQHSKSTSNLPLREIPRSVLRDYLRLQLTRSSRPSESSARREIRPR